MTISRMVTLMVLTGLAMWAAFGVGIYKAIAADTWVTASFASYHFDRSKDYNERNFGAGLERSISENVRLVAGAYRNSFYRTSVYVGGVYAPLRAGVLSAGVVGGLVTGYQSSVSPGLAPTVMLELPALGIGLNALFLPKYGNSPGIVGLQGKFRW